MRSPQTTGPLQIIIFSTHSSFIHSVSLGNSWGTRNIRVAQLPRYLEPLGGSHNRVERPSWATIARQSDGLHPVLARDSDSNRTNSALCVDLMM